MNEGYVGCADLLVKRRLETKSGAWTEYLYRYAQSDIVVLAYGDWNASEAPLTRIHSTCFAAHYLASIECDCREQLDIAISRVVEAGSGILIFLEQDGRGNGHAALMRAAVYAREHRCTQTKAYSDLGYTGDARSFLGAASVLRSLGVDAVRLMTNNPKKLAAVAHFGIDVAASSIVTSVSDRPAMTSYYRYKLEEGHNVSEAFDDTADEG